MLTHFICAVKCDNFCLLITGYKTCHGNFLLFNWVKSISELRSPSLLTLIAMECYLCSFDCKLIQRLWPLLYSEAESISMQPLSYEVSSEEVSIQFGKISWSGFFPSSP